MKERELKRLSRSDLLEMLLELSVENDRLTREVSELREKMAQRIIDVEESGSLAEAALKLNDVFRSAQAACEQYTQNVHARSEHLVAYCQQKEAQTQALCDAMLAETRKQCEQMLREAGGQPEAPAQEPQPQRKGWGGKLRTLAKKLGGGESK